MGGNESKDRAEHNRLILRHANTLLRYCRFKLVYHTSMVVLPHEATGKIDDMPDYDIIIRTVLTRLCACRQQLATVCVLKLHP